MYKISITGKANSGKNLTAKLLIKALFENNPIQNNYNFIAFADPIKKMASIAFPNIPKKWLYGSSKYRNEIIPGAFKDKVPLTVRQLLIDLGNNFGRQYQSDIWINNFHHKYNSLTNSDAIIVVDNRFRDEFNHLKSLGFYQIKLLRNSYTKIDDVSETDQDTIKNEEFDYILYNNGTLADLKNEVAKIVEILKNP